MNTGKQKKMKRVIKTIVIFIIFEIVFTCLTMPLFIFYGPFTEVKRLVAGASWNTFSHQYIVRFFLSDETIASLLKSSYAVDPTEYGERLRMLKLGDSFNSDIEIYHIDGGDFTGKLMVIHDPTRIAVGFSSYIPDTGEITSRICKNNGAIAGINAGGFIDRGWTGTGGAPLGFIIHKGKLVYDQMKDENLKQDTVAFTEEGMLIVGKHSIGQLQELRVKEAVSFGPPLIINGEATIKKGDGGWGIAPRTAIGQKETGEVLMLVIDGRTLNSFGATLKDAQDVLLEYGAYNAANLDGGSSTTMYFNGRLINKPSDKLGERMVPTTFLVLQTKDGADK